MGLKKFGIKTGSWLLNTDPKAKPKESDPRPAAILEDNFVNSNEVANSATLRDLISAESTPNLEYHDDTESIETASRLSRRKSSMSAPRALLRMFSSAGKKKDSTPSPTPSTHDLRRTTLSSSSVQLSQGDSSSEGQPRASISTMETNPVSRGSVQSPTSTHRGLSNPEDVLSPRSYGSVRPFATAAPASAASFTISPSLSNPTTPNPNEGNTPASLYSGPSSETTDLTTPRSSERGSESSSQNHALHNDLAVPIEFSQPYAISRIGMSSTSSGNFGLRSPGSSMTDPQPVMSSPSSQGTAPLSPGITSLINRELAGSISEEGENKTLRKEISRLTRELAELGEDRDRQVAKLGVLRTELGRSEATLKSEQISGRQELEALLELQAQHQTLLRAQRERNAEIRALSAEKEELEEKLAAALAQLHETTSSNAENSSLLLERNQLRGWLDEEKERHNEVRRELSQVKALLRTSEARINHLEMFSQEKVEEIRNLEKRDTEINESTQREVNYYQEQLNDALRSRDELRDELDRTKEQVHMLRRSMEQLLKAGVAEDNAKAASFSPRSTHSKASSVTDSSFLKGAGMSLDSRSRSGYSDDLESMTSSEFIAQPSNAGSMRYGLGHERRSTFGLDSMLNEPPSPSQAQAEPPMNQYAEPYEMSPRASHPTGQASQPTPPSIVSPVPEKPSTKDDSTYWDQRLKELLKEKERINLEYGRIPTSRVTISLRRRKENLEQALDQLDSDIAGARSKLRAFVM